MTEKKLSLSEFASEEGFELNKYITQLFDYVSKINNTPMPALSNELQNNITSEN